MEPKFIQIPSEYINLFWAYRIELEPETPLVVVHWANGIESTIYRGADALAVIDAVDGCTHGAAALPHLPVNQPVARRK